MGHSSNFSCVLYPEKLQPALSEQCQRGQNNVWSCNFLVYQGHEFNLGRINHTDIATKAQIHDIRYDSTSLDPGNTNLRRHNESLLVQFSHRFFLQTSIQHPLFEILHCELVRIDHAVLCQWIGILVNRVRLGLAGFRFLFQRLCDFSSNDIHHFGSLCLCYPSLQINLIWFVHYWSCHNADGHTFESFWPGIIWRIKQKNLKSNIFHH